MGITITPQTRHVGAVIGGVDVGAALDDDGLDGETVAAITRAFLDHHVICLRGQQITPDQHLAFARLFGEVLVHPYVPSIEGHPGVMSLGDPHQITVTWHSDTTHSPTPPTGSVLYALRIPPLGGDTMFANQHVAYDRLSSGMQQLLEGLRAVHEGTELAGTAGLEHTQVVSTHPVVRTHPDTRRKALYVNADYTTRFEDMTVEESAPLLRWLFDAAVAPEWTYRHAWREGDLLLWDNRSVQHRVVADVEPGERLLHRVTIVGDTPF